MRLSLSLVWERISDRVSRSSRNSAADMPSGRDSPGGDRGFIDVGAPLSCRDPQTAGFDAWVSYADGVEVLRARLRSILPLIALPHRVQTGGSEGRQYTGPSVVARIACDGWDGVDRIGPARPLRSKRSDVVRRSRRASVERVRTAQAGNRLILIPVRTAKGAAVSRCRRLDGRAAIFVVIVTGGSRWHARSAEARHDPLLFSVGPPFPPGPNSLTAVLRLSSFAAGCCCP